MSTIKEEAEPIIRALLDIIGYVDDKEKHVNELVETLQKSINVKTYEVIKEFFEDYIQTIKPTLSEEQTNKLRDYIVTLSGKLK